MSLRLLIVLLLSAPVLCLAQNKKWEATNQLSVTKHQINAGGGHISYTATAGYMPMKDEKDSVRASLFFIAYTKDGVDPATRPVMFAFNGGPGSSSVWLHMGMLGPKRVIMSDDGDALQPPYKYTDNDYTWLDKADLVFIDPMMTGYTRPNGNTPQSDFTGYDNDIRFVGDFIRLYLTKNKRWISPKFLAGESYGTTRAAGLANYLQDNLGIYINGVVLISAVLNFETIRTDRGNDLPFCLQLPSFAATAWYHKKLSPKYDNLKSLLKEVEQFSLNEYNNALMKGDRISPAERNALIDKLHDYTGLSKEYIDQTNLRLFVGRVNKELLRSNGKTFGRFDSRITGTDYDHAGDSYDYDPSFSKTVYGTYTAAINDYMRRYLNYENDLPYEILTGRVWPWTNVTDRYLNVADGLRSAMVKNQFLKVWICNGYYDLATPYFATEYVVHHMYLPEHLKQNVTSTYYESGHMEYVHKPSLLQLKTDFNKFMKGTLNTGVKLK